MTIVSNLSGICDLTIKPDTRVSAGIRFLAVFEIALIVATWPLWWGHSEFPQVPLLPIFAGSWLSKVFTGCLLLSASLIALPRRTATSPNALIRFATIGACVTSLVLVVLNQHRLQAWHWLFLLNTGWMLVVPGTELLKLMRHTICTVYVCSALSRISLQPLSGMTGAIVYKSLAMAGVTGLAPDGWLPIVLCHAMTLGELLIGFLLLATRTRLAGCIGAMLLHLSLLIILGPLGLNHHAGVLLWNLCFLCLIPALFLGKDVPAMLPCEGRTATTLLCITAAWLFPLSGLAGIADNWPSWQLYSSRPETWVLFIHDEDRNVLPQSIAEITGDPVPLSEWCPVKLDRWSLKQTGSPMYPQGRFQLAIAARVLARIPGDIRFQIEVSEPQSPFWWKRRRRSINDRGALQRERSRFLLNSTATNPEVQRPDAVLACGEGAFLRRP